MIKLNILFMLSLFFVASCSTFTQDLDVPAAPQPDSVSITLNQFALIDDLEVHGGPVPCPALGTNENDQSNTCILVNRYGVQVILSASRSNQELHPSQWPVEYAVIFTEGYEEKLITPQEALAVLISAQQTTI